MEVVSASVIPYPAIVNKSLFAAAQQRKLDHRILVDKSTKHNTILSKLIECPECHTFLFGDYRKSRQAGSYRCGKHKGTGKCGNTSMLSMQYIDSLVWCYLKTNVKQIIEEIYKKNYAVNIPLKDGMDDESYKQIFEPVSIPLSSLSIGYNKMCRSLPAWCHCLTVWC